MDWNKTVFVGKVKGAPKISARDGKKNATITFTIKDRIPGANGQWTDRFMDVLLFTSDDKKAEVVEKWVKPDHELLIECQYMNWESNGQMQHGFKILTIGLGYAPKSKEPASSGGGEDSPFPM
jgi:single-stranded DNA-binding protein